MIKDKKSKKVLIVDDNDNFRRFILRVLIKEYENVYEAKDASTALDIFEKENFDLIILDIFIPKMSGIDLAKKILSKNENVKFIIISGYTDNIDDAPDDVKKNSIFLQKPFTPQKLIEAIENL
jgi:DNA-binding NtrC family response regulator